MLNLEMAIRINNPALFKRYGNVFPNPVDYGIFNGLNTYLTALEIPNYDMESLNLLYYQRSKFKRISGSFEMLINMYGVVLAEIEPEDYYTINAAAYAKIINMIKTKNLYNWSKLVETYKKEYDILSPFNMIVKDDSTDNLESSDESESSSVNSETSKGDYQGFNSTEYNPVDKNTVDGSDHNERASSYVRDNTHHRDTVRHGNIGNRSSQELIKEERGLWVWNLYEQMFSDIDKTITKGIY